MKIQVYKIRASASKTIIACGSNLSEVREDAIEKFLEDLEPEDVELKYLEGIEIECDDENTLEKVIDCVTIMLDEDTSVDDVILHLELKFDNIKIRKIRGRKKE